MRCEYLCVAVIAILIASAPVCPAEDMTDAIERVGDSLFKVTAGERVGAGFIVSTDGHGLTSAHVVGEVTEITVTLANGEERSVTVVSSDEVRDLALLDLGVQNLPVVQFASAAGLKQGMKVAALGAPLGLEGSVTEGIVSAVGRQINEKEYLQIDAALNEGNSGGPVIDEKGRVVGVATAMVKEAENVGFAISSDEAIEFLQSAGIAVNLPLGEGGGAVSVTPGPGPTQPTVPIFPPPTGPKPPRLLLLIGIPLAVSLVVSLVVALLVIRAVRRGPSAPEVSLAPPSPAGGEEDDLSDIEITLE